MLYYDPMRSLSGVDMDRSAGPDAAKPCFHTHSRRNTQLRGWHHSDHRAPAASAAAEASERERIRDQRCVTHAQSCQTRCGKWTTKYRSASAGISSFDRNLAHLEIVATLWDKYIGGQTDK